MKNLEKLFQAALNNADNQPDRIALDYLIDNIRSSEWGNEQMAIDYFRAKCDEMEIDYSEKLEESNPYKAEVPKWSEAPHWANFAAKDGNGSWYWYEERPSYRSDREWHSNKRCERCRVAVNWKESVQTYLPEGAPSWAKFMARDMSGNYWYHENQPEILFNEWINDGRSEEVGGAIPSWASLIVKS